jgi:hypothetical protein
MGLPNPESTLSKSPLYPRVNLLYIDVHLIHLCPLGSGAIYIWCPLFRHVFVLEYAKNSSGAILNSATAREKEPLPKFFFVLLE